MAQEVTEVSVTYVEHDGTAHMVDVPLGHTVMEGAIFSQVRGIHASCAGDCECATCHVYVDEAWRSKTGEMSAKEKRSLRYARDVAGNSRLSCQIVVVQELDGLVVRMPERQF